MWQIFKEENKRNNKTKKEQREEWHKKKKQLKTNFVYLFTSPAAEGIVKGFSTMNQISCRVPAIFSQTCETE